MKIVIEYKYKNDGSGSPFWAYTYFYKEYFSSCADSFEAAKKQLLKRIEAMASIGPVTIPLPEEVEIDTEAHHANAG